MYDARFTPACSLLPARQARNAHVVPSAVWHRRNADGTSIELLPDGRLCRHGGISVRCHKHRLEPDAECDRKRTTHALYATCSSSI